ncbi:MAG TPA: hypothetical protein VLB44_02485 [Kofleriaceae bacterium]|nr:hypothetical protein [Kofleriaceae bacterium]
MTSPAVRAGLTPVGTGILLGVLNVLVISLGMSVAVREPHTPLNVGVGMFVFLFGIMPGVIAGAVLGLVAELLTKRPRWLRLVVLVLPAVGIVALVAYPFNLQTYVPVASIPTLVATLILERATRHQEPQVVPAARVESSVRIAR